MTSLFLQCRQNYLIATGPCGVLGHNSKCSLLLRIQFERVYDVLHHVLCRTIVCFPLLA